MRALRLSGLPDACLAARWATRSGVLWRRLTWQRMGRGLPAVARLEVWAEGYDQDDTQFSMWLLQSLIPNGGVEPCDLVRRFSAEKIRGIGQAPRDFVRNAKDLRKPWFESGVASASNGVAMRSAPIGLFYREDSKALKFPQPDLDDLEFREDLNHLVHSLLL